MRKDAEDPRVLQGEFAAVGKKHPPGVAQREVSETHRQGISRSPMEVQVEVKVDTQVLKELRHKRRNGKKTSKS